MAKHEYIIENCTKEEIEKIKRIDDKIDWYPDDLQSNDVCIYGTKEDVKMVLKIIGR